MCLSDVIFGEGYDTKRWVNSYVTALNFVWTILNQTCIKRKCYV